jgi:hypothetical protein
LSPHAAAPTLVSQRLSGWQHPKRQLVASQRVHAQALPTHAWSVRHAAQTSPFAPHAVAAVPGRQTPSPSRQPAHEALTHTPSSHRCVAAQVPQNAFAGPHAEMSLFGAQRPSGRQHDDGQEQMTGPASTTPASTTGTASHTAAAQRSPEVQRAHSPPPRPHSKREVPATHSPSAQHPSHVDALHGLVHAADTATITARKHQRMWAPL